ncbi:Replication protein A 14 kDa subunit B [Zea mays]|uniref:Replication protein A 14 kDa subunit B n=1 Tax=Zea mays TaxID=4577 RepID=A0A1D6JRM4_MAIZE|nr:Replication protein A 14 kDa subunit B [Zea mays]
MEIIAIAGYITDAKMHIARDYLEKNTRQACGIKADQLDNLRWRPRKRSRRSGSRKQSDTSSGSSSGDMDLSSPGPSGFCQLNLVPDEETCKSSGEQPFMGVPVQSRSSVMTYIKLSSTDLQLKCQLQQYVKCPNRPVHLLFVSGSTLLRLRTVAQVQHNEGGVLVGQSTDGHQLCVKSAMDVPVSHFMEVYEIAENSETIRAEVCTDFGPNFGEIANAFGVCLGPLIAIVSIVESNHILNEVSTDILPSHNYVTPIITIAGGSVANTIRGLSAGFGISTGDYCLSTIRALVV